MALMDYLNGPKHHQRVVQLKAELVTLQERYAHLQALAKKYGAMDVAEVQELIVKETVRLELAQRNSLPRRSKLPPSSHE